MYANSDLFWCSQGVDKRGLLSLTNGFAVRRWTIRLRALDIMPDIISFCASIWLASPSAVAVGLACRNLSMKVSLRSPVLFFLIKLIRHSAMGARLTAARDCWCTYSNLRAVILRNCSEMWATWVIATTQDFRDIACFSAIIKQAALPVQLLLFFFFISCCFWALRLGL